MVQHGVRQIKKKRLLRVLLYKVNGFVGVELRQFRRVGWTLNNLVIPH